MSNIGLSAYKEGAEESVSPPALPKKPSTIPKVMGVMHLVIGGLFAVSGLLSLIQGSDQSEKLQQQFAALEQGGVTITQEAIDSLSAIAGPSAIVNGFDLLASLLMVVAGVGLVKYQRWGRLFSNIYVAVTLLVKGANCYVLSVLAAPFYVALVESVPALEEIGAEGLKSVVLGSVFLSALYPIVSVLVVNLKACRLALR